MKKNYLITSFFIAALSLSSCLQEGKVNDEEPIARVLDDYLYPSDLVDLVPSNLSVEDSIRIARRLIEEWSKNKLLLHQAETHLPPEQKEIEKQVEEYRSSLLIYKYKQLLLGQNLDNNITDQEIKEYYDENHSNYILESDLVQVNYVKIPVSAPQISQVRYWSRSDREDNIQKLKDYAAEYAEQYSIGDTSWIYFSEAIKDLPINIDNPSIYLNYNRNIEASDSAFYHFMRIKNRLKEGEIKPLELVSGDIRSVLLNKRKIEYIQDLENTVYKEGKSRNQVEIY